MQIYLEDSFKVTCLCRECLHGMFVPVRNRLSVSHQKLSAAPRWCSEGTERIIFFTSVGAQMFAAACFLDE